MMGRAVAIFSLPLLLTAACGDESSTDPGDTTPPEQVDDLRTVASSDTSIRFTWTAPGDDGDQGTASLYQIRYSEGASHGPGWWDSVAIAIVDPPIPREGGASESLWVGPLAPETDYQFALRAADEVPNWSEMSNVATRSTGATPDLTPPEAVNDLAVTGQTDSSFTLSWSAVGDDRLEGTAARYDIRYAEEKITEETWTDAVALENEPSPGSTGESENYEATGLPDGSAFWFALKVADEAGNWSALSNVTLGEWDDVPPARVSDLSIEAATESTLVLVWTATGDDGDQGTAAALDLRYHTDPITEENWNEAITSASLPPVGEAGTPEMFTVAGLDAETVYYFALVTCDEAGNCSELSNVVIGMTAAPGGGRIWTIRPDGSGDHATIRDAVEAAISGDIIELVDGVYTGDGNRGVRYNGKSITVRSQSGAPVSCVIDCEGAGRAFDFRFGEGVGSSVQRITVRNGAAGGTSPNGGAIRISGASPRLIGCIFEANWAPSDGGAVYCEESTGAIITDCLFRGNRAIEDGGGIDIYTATVRLTNCTFVENFATKGGGVHTIASYVDIRGCDFIRCWNEGGAFQTGGGLSYWSSAGTVEGCVFQESWSELGGGMMLVYASPEIRACTFVLNFSERGGALDLWGSFPEIRNCLIAFNYGTDAVTSQDNFPPLSCCNLYGNETGDWVGAIEGQGEINNNGSEDPLFCDMEHGDLTLFPDSPCLPEHSPECGRIGALSVGCGR